MSWEQPPILWRRFGPVPQVSESSELTSTETAGSGLSRELGLGYVQNARSACSRRVVEGMYIRDEDLKIVAKSCHM